MLCLPTSLRADNRPYCSGNTAGLVDTASTWPDPLPETGKDQLVLSPLQSFSLNKSPPRLCPDCVQRPADPAFPPRPLPWLTLLPTLALLGLLMVGVPHRSSLQRISSKLPEIQRGLLAPPPPHCPAGGLQPPVTMSTHTLRAPGHWAVATCSWWLPSWLWPCWPAH